MIKTTNADASLFHSLKVCLVKWLDLLHKQKWKARIGSNRSRLERCSSLLPNLITRNVIRLSCVIKKLLVYYFFVQIVDYVSLGSEKGVSRYEDE